MCCIVFRCFVIVFLFFLLCVVAIAWCQYKVFANEMKEINNLTMEIIKDSTASIVLTRSSNAHTGLRLGLHPYPYLLYLGNIQKLRLPIFRIFDHLPPSVLKWFSLA